jgi:3-deoxy-manno-octulosonate cytidylyltransferase (CMP-KDO synthetase)
LRTVAVIPCRYGSTRLPGKAILSETGKPLVQHVYENVCRCESIDHVIVAADDQRILDAAGAFGAPAELTSSAHLSGTDRMAEVASRVEGDIFVNVQSDEPELDPACIDAAVNALLDDESCSASTICSPVGDRCEFDDPHTVKCVVNREGYALYFSRAPIPYPRFEDRLDGALGRTVLKHHGVYCFRRDALLAFPCLVPPEMESLEGLEQLRLLWHGHRIRVCLVPEVPKGIDTPEDYRSFVTRMNRG